MIRYNVRLGGTAGYIGFKMPSYPRRKWTDKEKSERSTAMIGVKNHFFGKTHSDETKIRLQKACAKFGEDNGFYGKNHTDRTRKVLSEKAKSRTTHNPLPPPKYGQDSHMSGEYVVTSPDGRSWKIRCRKDFSEKYELCNKKAKIISQQRHNTTNEK